MEYVFLGIPLAIWIGACVAGYFSSKTYKSHYTTRIGRTLDCFTHTAFTIIGGIVLYPEIVHWLGWENMNVIAVIFVTSTLDELIKFFKATAKNYDKLKEFIHNHTKPPK